MGVKVDLVGQVFGRLTVISFAGTTEDRMARLWTCRCSCDGSIVVPTKRLRNGTTKSCGCLQSETTASRNYVHGKSKTALYNQWTAMHSRCYNQNNPAYPRYGGRGISVHPRWHDFELFLSDVGEKPANMSIDREENNGNYGPDNFRWATGTQQNQNRRDNVKIRMVDGQVLVLAEAERVLGLSRGLLSYHLKTHGTYKGVTYGLSSIKE